MVFCELESQSSDEINVGLLGKLFVELLFVGWHLAHPNQLLSVYKQKRGCVLGDCELREVKKLNCPEVDSLCNRN